MRHVGTAVALLVALLLPVAAAAQVREAALARVRLLNKAAMEQYDDLEFEDAKSKLEEAIQEAKAADLESAPDLAKTYMYLGVVYGAGLDDRSAAVKHFTDALKLDPNVELDPMRATPVMEELWKTARDNARAAAPAPAKQTLTHEPRDEAPAGEALKLYARLSPGFDPHRVLLYYRTIGESAFHEVVMTEAQKGLFVGEIPAGSVVHGKALYYYVEAQDDAGQRLAGHGEGSSPNIIAVTPGQGGPGGGGGGTEPEPDKARHRFSVAVMVGTGGGFVYGGATENAGYSIEKDEACEREKAAGKPVSCRGPGGAWAPFHISPELSYHITAKWHLALLGRIQVVNSISTERNWASHISALGILRAKRFFGDGRLKFYAAAGAGGGQVRHRIKAESAYWDTRIAQYVAFNLGGGMTLMFHEHIGLMVDVAGLILVPDFAAHADLNLGLVASF